MIIPGGYYKVRKTFDAACLYHWKAPFTSGDDVTLPEELVFQVDSSPVESASAEYVCPVPYNLWEAVFVPPGTRYSSRYGGYSLIINKKEIPEYCELVQEERIFQSPYHKILSGLEGSLMGTAVGDALGLPFEGLSPERIQRWKAFPLKQRFFFGRGMISDDTEHSCMVAQALVRSGGDPELFVKHLSKSMKWWLLGMPAGIGLATLKSILKLWMRFGYAKSGVFSAGNGPSMRSAIIGVFAGHEEDLLRSLIRLSTRLTHTDPKAEKGSLIVARAAALSAAKKNVPPEECLKIFSPYMEGDEELTTLIRLAAESAQRKESAQQFCKSIKLENGITGYIYHTLPVVMQVWLRFPLNYGDAMEEIVACGGDTDTAAAILGGIIGAGVGVEGIPEPWRRDLVDWPRSKEWMSLLSSELSAVKITREKSPASGVSLPGVIIRNILFMGIVLMRGFRRLFPPY